MINTNKKKIKEEQQKKSETRIEQQNNGRAIITIFGSKVARGWIWTERGLSPGDKLRCIQAMSNSTTSMNNKHRGDPDMKKRRCRWSRDGIEDNAHILNKCRMNEGLITKRHDFIVNKIGKELKKQSD